MFQQLKSQPFCLMEKKSIPNVEISIQTITLLQFRFILLACFPFCPSPPLCSSETGSDASPSLSADPWQLSSMEWETSPCPAEPRGRTRSFQIPRLWDKNTRAWCFAVLHISSWCKATAKRVDDGFLKRFQLSL